MFVFIWFTSLSMTISISIHVAANGIISFFLWLRNIPFYICTTSIYKIFATLSLCILIIEKQKDIKNEIVYNLITLDNHYFGIFYF